MNVKQTGTRSNRISRQADNPSTGILGSATGCTPQHTGSGNFPLLVHIHFQFQPTIVTGKFADYGRLVRAALMPIALAGHSQGTNGFRIQFAHLPSLNTSLIVHAGHGESNGHDPLLPLPPRLRSLQQQQAVVQPWGVSLRCRIKSTGGKSLGTNSSGSSMTARAIFGGCQR